MKQGLQHLGLILDFLVSREWASVHWYDSAAQTIERVENIEAAS